MPPVVGVDAAPPAASLLRRAESGLEQFRRELAELVSIDSGSLDADGVDAAARWSAERFTALGFATEFIPTPRVDGIRYGSAVVARRRGSGTRRILLFAHLDTVFEKGAATARPYREEGGRAYGPGVSDDKAGAATALLVMRMLQDSGYDGFGELVVAFTPDEEVGSPASGALLRALAAEADAALCLECARENGDLVSARKGIADVVIDVQGRAAHSGIEPDRGANAAVEAAHLLLFLQSLNDAERGVTVNVGTVKAGHRRNIVPAHARLSGEVRAWTLADLDATLDAIDARAGEALVDGVEIRVERQALCPPLEPASSARVLALAVAAGVDLGVAIRGSRTGGVSDANFAAATGVPVLDGLGPIGGDDHAESEWLDLASVPERAALLARLVIRIAED